MESHDGIPAPPPGSEAILRAFALSKAILIDGLEKTFPGYLLVFFPGEKEGNTYRFLDARTGWNYLAVPILSEK